MKTINLVLCFMVTISCWGFGQSKMPPAAVAQAFKEKFKTATQVKWGKEKNGDWEAEFTQDKQEMSANYSSAGAWLETEMELAFDALPNAVKTALKGKKVKEVAKIIHSDGLVVYEAEVGNKDLLFNENGQAIVK